MSKRSIKITETQLKFILDNSINEIKRGNKDWTKSGSEWEWTDEDEAATNKMKSDSIQIRKNERRKKHEKFLSLMRSVQNKD